MIVLGLAGHAGVGKSIIANYLAERYGFVKINFSDALYEEVAAAYGLEDQEILRDRNTKDTPLQWLAADQCSDSGFVTVLKEQGVDVGGADGSRSLSPRQVLQWWGTEYRRAQDPDYWVKQADAAIYKFWTMFQYGEQRPQMFVNDTCRFANEQAWIHKFTNGNVWHIHRDGVGVANAHVSETPLPVLERERQLWNNDTVQRLFDGVELLLSTQAKFVRVEPMLPYDPNAAEQGTEKDATQQNTAGTPQNAPPVSAAPGLVVTRIDEVEKTEDQQQAAIDYAKGH